MSSSSRARLARPETLKGSSTGFSLNLDQIGRVDPFQVHQPHGPAGKAPFGDLLIVQERDLLVARIAQDVPVEMIDGFAPALDHLHEDVTPVAEDARHALGRVLGAALRRIGVDGVSVHTAGAAGVEEADQHGGCPSNRCGSSSS